MQAHLTGFFFLYGWNTAGRFHSGGPLQASARYCRPATSPDISQISGKGLLLLA